MAKVKVLSKNFMGGLRNTAKKIARTGGFRKEICKGASPIRSRNMNDSTAKFLGTLYGERCVKYAYSATPVLAETEDNMNGLYMCLTDDSHLAYSINMMSCIKIYMAYCFRTLNCSTSTCSAFTAC
jgi:hypothetical protein